MENKTFSETEQAVVLKLVETVNSEEDFNWVESQLILSTSRATEVRDGLAH